MSTRSIIAVPHEDNWRGRYVHWDGYPAHMGQELSEILRRDGYAKAVKVLTEDYKSWSSISSTIGATERLVAGYGEPHTDIPDNEDPWIYPQDEDWTEWVYLLLPFGIAVYIRQSVSDDIFAGLYDWDENWDWKEIQDSAMQRLEVG